MSEFRFVRDNAPWLAAGAVLTLLSSFGQTFFISLFAGHIRVEFGLSHGGWGGLYSLGTTASALVMVWAGGLTDRFRVRALGPVILLTLSAACLAMALNPWAWMLPIIIFALRFAGQGMLSHLAIVAMARWFVATRGRALSIATLGFSAGEAFLPLIFVALMTLLDWRILWLIAAAIALLGIPVLWRLLGQERQPRSLAAADQSLGMDGRAWTRAQTLRHPLFWILIPALLGPSAFNTAFFFHQVHFAQIKGISHVDLVALFPLYTAVGVAAMIGSGWLLDRIGTARLMPFVQLPMVFAFAIFSLTTGPVTMIAGFICLGLTTGANSTVPNAFWAEFYGTAHLGKIKALATAVMVLGSAVGPGLTGVLIDLGQGLERQFIAIALYFIVSSVLIWTGIGGAKARLSPPARR